MKINRTSSRFPVRLNHLPISSSLSPYPYTTSALIFLYTPLSDTATSYTPRQYPKMYTPFRRRGPKTPDGLHPSLHRRRTELLKRPIINHPFTSSSIPSTSQVYRNSSPQHAKRYETEQTYRSNPWPQIPFYSPTVLLCPAVLSEAS